MRNLLIGLSSGIGLLICSCQKEVDVNPPAILTSDSSYLDKIIILDTTQPSGMDTVEKISTTYDASKRLVTYAGQSSGYSTTQTFFYSGNDTLPFKHVVRDVFGPVISADTIFFTYSNGIVVRDSMNSWNITTGMSYGAEVSEFTVTGSNVSTRDKSYVLVAGNYVLMNDIVSVVSLTTSGGNILTQNPVSGQPSYDLVQATYDSKNNPLSKIIKTHYANFESRYFESWLLQRNNAIQINYKEPGFPPESDAYTYQYRNDNYPKSATYHSTAGSTGNKILYFYKTL